MSERPESAGGPVPDPRSDAAVWEVLAQWRREGRRFVLATVTGSRGFTPRKPGAHMLIAEDGATAGTIGGGAIEHEVLEAARALFATGGSITLERHLTQELGMCCGGEMAVFLEVLEPAPCLVLFGAGYIARPLAALAASCGFAVTVVDERPEWTSRERFPDAAVELREPEAYARERDFRGDEFAVVVTHDHAIDQRLVQVLLRRPLRFVGMIGSIPKQRKFAQRLAARGFDAAEIARLRTPLGVSIGADSPEEIAVSVMAELIAVRRGATPAPAWTPKPRAASTFVDLPSEPRATDDTQPRDAPRAGAAPQRRTT